MGTLCHLGVDLQIGMWNFEYIKFKQYPYANGLLCLNNTVPKIQYHIMNLVVELLCHYK